MTDRPLRLRLALVLLLVSMNLLRRLLPDSWALGFWAFVVDLLILLVIVGEIAIRWWISRKRSLVDQAVLRFLASQVSRRWTVEEISLNSDVKNIKKIKASLLRLQSSRHVNDNGQDQWRIIYP